MTTTTRRAAKPEPKPLSPIDLFRKAVGDHCAGSLDANLTSASLADLRMMRDISPVDWFDLAAPLVVAEVQNAISAELDRRAAEERKAFEEEIRRQIARTRAAVDRAVASIGNYSAYAIDSQWSPVGAYLKAVAERDFWAAVEHVAEVIESHDLLEAVGLYAEEVRKALIDNRYKPASSDPTSCAALIFQGEAAANFVRHYLVTATARMVKGEAL
jgi:hypothetical protein